MAQQPNPDRMPALVTGGARRIGRAIVEALAEDGHPIAIHCNTSREEADRLAAAILAKGGTATVVQGDLSDLDAIDGLFGRAEAMLGPVGLLVNNASVFEDDEMRTIGPDSLTRHLSINLAAPTLLAAALAKRLPATATGLVVNIIDQRVVKPTPEYLSYSLSKAGLWWVTQTMAQALAPRVRVVGIGPGTTLRNARQTKAAFDRLAAGSPLGQGPALAEFGATIRWLRDTPSVTGQLIFLDGGQHLAWTSHDIGEAADEDRPSPLDEGA